ncbi:MAG: hypothetical protein H6703_05255 [Myxococcales bacterium]|nr:hypothetical protein [Myxococcales bacterium]
MRAAVFASIALALVLAAPADAQPRRARADAITPHAADVYGPDDPLAAQKARVDEIMGVFEVHPPRRHPAERTRIKGSAVQIEVWHPIGRNTDVELKTRAVEWFVFGRTQYAEGVRGVFSEMPDVKDIRFTFIDVIRPDEKGRRQSKQEDQIKIYLLLHLDRRRFEQLPIEALEGCVARGDCSAEFRSSFKDARFDRQYTRKAREEE